MTRLILPGPFSDLRPASTSPFCPFAPSPFPFPCPLLPLPPPAPLERTDVEHERFGRRQKMVPFTAPDLSFVDYLHTR